MSFLIPVALFAAGAYAQQVGTLQAETHPSLSVSTCTASGCTAKTQSIVLDSNWRWVHSTSGSTNCYTGNTWNAQLCPDDTTCAANCALDGADYSGTYGITTTGNSLKLNFVTKGPNSQTPNIGSRVYLMADDSHYQMFNLKNQEFTFTVDVSNLPCGLNGALYFVQMDADGGMAKYPTNKAGAKYGTGYCDTQCPQDIKFINGQANSAGWSPSSNDVNAGTGQYGSCCNEMDIWEANSVSAALTPHVCSGITGQARCTGTTCGAGSDRYNGYCDKDGCDFNSYRWGNTTFYGAGKTVDTKSPFTVVTQFITSDGTANGDLTEIRRLYVQNGKVIQNSYATYPTLSQYNSITDGFCNAQKTLTGDTNSFEQKGGLKGMGQAYQAGMVLVMSLWDDHSVNMLWLDSDYPTTASVTSPGVARGTCPTDSGKPATVEAGSASVIYSDIRTGPIGSTYKAGTSSPPTTSSGPTTTSAPPTQSSPAASCAAKYAQCGGQGWAGATCCAAGSTCKVSNPYYSQCL